MRHFLTLVAILSIFILTVRPVSAGAKISGPPCIIDGNTIQVGGKIKNQQCWGGINVRLHGSITPGVNDKCPRADGSFWNCGQVAKDALANMIRMNTVDCYHVDGAFEASFPVATCLSGRRDLALELVVKGMAKAHYDQSNRYAREEKEAKQAKLGVWNDR